MRSEAAPLRLFLDAGVIIEGCLSSWGAAKAVTILTTYRQRYTVVLAEQIEEEVRRGIARKLAALPDDQAKIVAMDFAGWFARVRVERRVQPTSEDLQRYAPGLLPVLRHSNDLPAVIAAMQARPDWVISSNDEHWNDAVAERTGLRIVTPAVFLRRLSPLADGA